MKRDMKLVRAILLWAVEQPHGGQLGNPTLEGWTDEQIGYHVQLMDQAGLVRAAVHRAVSRDRPTPGGVLLEVTWDGHDFADAARDESVWRKAGGTVLREGASITFGLLKEWLVQEAKRQIGMPG